jgi:hypothetical protein
MKFGPKRSLAALTTVMVAAAIVAGLIVADSPAEERGRKLDQRRSENLSQISYALTAYREQRESLPDTLSELERPGFKSGYVNTLNDPATDEPYEYRRLNPDQFELCAFFADTAPKDEFESRIRPIGPPGTEEPDFWRHGAGRQCWTVTPAGQRIFCGEEANCPPDKVCASAPGYTRPVCLPQDGDLCSAAGCPDTCSLSKTVPVQVECLDSSDE